MEKQGKTRKQTDYSKGKVYKIISDCSDKIYIGSTAQHYLCDRLSNHKSEYNRWIKTEKGYCSSFELLKLNNCKIILLCNYPCNSKAELQMKEQECMDEYKNKNPNLLLNLFRSHNTKEYKKQYKKNWSDNNPTDRTEYYKEWNSNEEVKKKKKESELRNKKQITCECGCVISSCSKYLHLKSKKHLKNMELKTDI